MNRIELSYRQLVYTIQTADKIYVLATTSGKPFHVLADKNDLICWAKIGPVDVQKGYRETRGYVAKKGGDSDKYDDPSGLCATLIVDRHSTTTIYLQPVD